MPNLIMASFDVGILAAECVSMALGCAALAVLVALNHALLNELICFTTAGCLVVSILRYIASCCIKSKILAIAISALLLPCCVATGLFAVREFKRESFSDHGCPFDISSSIVAASCAAFGFTVLEVGIAWCGTWRRTERTKLTKCEESLAWLEENRQEDGLEYPFGPTISPRNRVAKSAIPRERQQRPRSKVGLWNDDVITTARIPREKIDVGELISQGAYGKVYKGAFNGLVVAVKKMHPVNAKSVSHVNNFLAEVKLMASLDHPCIVQFVGVAWDSLSDLCAVTEFMDGGDLTGLLASYDNQHHPVGFDDNKVKIALHVAHGLTYLHSLSPLVIHRDLKSRNILLTAELDAKLTDFGVSRERADHTMTAGVGTSLWMAPEVLMGERYDDKADIFSFGVVLSELDLQVLPYSHAIEMDGSGRRMRDTAVLQRMAMGKLRVQFSPEAIASMVALGNECVSLDPVERPTAAEVLYKLQVIQRDEL